jgi:IS5 family transposase
MWYNLSDVQVIEQVKDRISFRSFAIGDFNCPVPDDTTLVRFRNRLKERKIYDKLLAKLEISMKRHDINVRCGIVAVDATIVQASSGVKEAETGAKWTYREGKGAVFGYKVHVAMDTESRIIEEVEVTSAAASETNHLLVPEDAEVIVADKGYDSDANRYRLFKHNIEDGIMRKKPRLEDMSDEDVEHNKLISRHRAKIESKFGEMKRYNGLNRARYVGIERFKIQAILTIFAVNLKRYIKLLGD